MGRRKKRLSSGKRQLAGFIVEHRFFAFINVPRPERPEEFLFAERSDPLLDVRGIDGFLVFADVTRRTGVRRIPIQLKTGTGEEIGFGRQHIPVIQLHRSSNLHDMLQRIRSILCCAEIMSIDYDAIVCRINSNGPSPNERPVLEKVMASRSEVNRRMLERAALRRGTTA